MSQPLSIVAYKSCLPSKNKKQEKVDALIKFCLGAHANGDNAYMHEGQDTVPCDVAVILGWVHEDSKKSPHLQMRKRIADEQRAKNKHLVIIDSNLFLYKNTKNPLNYLRYSFNGVFPNTGIYCDTNPTLDRWLTFGSQTNLKLQPYRGNGNHILLCLQRQGGWSMGGIDVQSWIASTVSAIRMHSNRPIRLRAHPGDKTLHDFGQIINQFSNVHVSPANNSLLDDLANCWAVVNHNSSPVVGAAIEGYPIFVTDPERSQCKEIANTDFAKIEDPVLYDRQLWLTRLSMFHWNFAEVESGQCWAHMRRYLPGIP
jgi:hypothetical protein